MKMRTSSCADWLGEQEQNMSARTTREWRQAIANFAPLQLHQRAYIYMHTLN